MKDITLVSALFNIEREEMDGRTWNEYLKWFDKTLNLNCPMILFATEDLQDFIEQRRLTIPTEVIIQTIEEIPYYSLKNQIDDILLSDFFKENVQDIDRIECKHSMYSVIQYSKFKWLEQAIEENPFNSKFFFWMDAGASRFFQNYEFSQVFPSKNAVESLEEIGDKFLIQMNMEYYKNLATAETLSDDYLYDCRSFTLGSFFGGTENGIRQVSNQVDNVLRNQMMANGFINNEQIALGYLLKKKPDLFVQYERYNGEHMDLFNELTKN
jgi:hypothetical protein